MLNRNNAIVLLLIVLWVGTWAVKTDRIDLPWPATTEVDRVTYVYEKDDGAVPRQVAYSIGELNKVGILATECEVDAENGLGQIPTQDRIAVDAANAVGLPALIVQSGEKVVGTVKAPTTVAEMSQASGVAIKEPR